MKTIHSFLILTIALTSCGHYKGIKLRAVNNSTTHIQHEEFSNHFIGKKKQDVTTACVKLNNAPEINSSKELMMDDSFITIEEKSATITGVKKVRNIVQMKPATNTLFTTHQINSKVPNDKTKNKISTYRVGQIISLIGLVLIFFGLMFSLTGYSSINAVFFVLGFMILIVGLIVLFIGKANRQV